MSLAIWRVRPLAAPPWAIACTRCRHPWLESTGRFRVNSNGRLHDVWLSYRCAGCGARRKRSIHRRVREGGAAPSLEAYRRDDPELAMRCAFATASPGAPLPYRVERAPLPAGGTFEVRVVQPLFCDVRWDRFLARELGWTRARVRAAWEGGDLRVDPRGRPGRAVRDGDRLRLRLGGPARRVRHRRPW